MCLWFLRPSRQLSYTRLVLWLLLFGLRTAAFPFHSCPPPFKSGPLEGEEEILGCPYVSNGKEKYFI